MKGGLSRLHPPPPPEDRHRHVCCRHPAVRKISGLLLVAVAAFMFSLITLCVKTAILDGMLFGGVLLFKSLFTLVINYVVGCVKHVGPRAFFGPPRKVPLLILLGVAGALAQLSAFYAVSILSMGDANVYLMSSPVFVFLLARMWLGDPIDAGDIIAALVCIAGVFFVSKPSAVFGCETTDDCTLTQFCALNGTCLECGETLSDALFDTPTADDNYTAYEICSGVEQLTNTTIVDPALPESEWSVAGPLYCAGDDDALAAAPVSSAETTTTGVDVVVVHPTTARTCQWQCLHEYTGCSFFTAGVVNDDALTCILYLTDTCNATNAASASPLAAGNVFTELDASPPALFRMLGESRATDISADASAIGMAIFSAAAAALTYCVIRKLGRSVDGVVAVHYHALLSTAVGGAVCAWQGLPLPVTPLVWGAVVGLGCAGFVGQWALTIGFQLEKPGPASVVRYCDVIFVFVWDAVFFATVPGWNSYVGAALVILAAVGIVVNKGFKERRGIKQQAPLFKFGDCACCCPPGDEPDEEDSARGGHFRGDARRQAELRSKLRAIVHATAGIHMMSFHVATYPLSPRHGAGAGRRGQPRARTEGAEVEMHGAAGGGAGHSGRGDGTGANGTTLLVV